MQTHLDINLTLSHHRGVRTTLTLQPDVYAAAQRLAKLSGQSLGDVISELARRGLNPPLSFEAPLGADRFQTVKVPQGTPAIRLDLIEQFLEDEGAV